ncbi:molybdopterin molybdotransferase MoeA [Halomonas sp. SH5A2]|uniref:molybdopterin molybdotransferase MoeA n=1 Tax=Halomonas sp. SH5A2 TaxID=2749040 RepID=UPI00163F71D9|nr:gephyrin-like molybdotransferase Glp [Halomonas sp. SH5A2]QNI02943.1 molybdopterin molybdotransferase MoeA [Halomonas sp. SH5A2]
MNCGCSDRVATRLINVFTARQQLIDAAVPLEDPECIALADAFGRVLAVPAIAPLDMPGVDNSAMDGYALRMMDYQAAHQRGGLPVMQRVPAGAGVLALPEGGCARIFTGAPVPLGADTVVPQERVTVDLQGHIHVDGVLEPGANIRKQSEETKVGSTLLPKGNYLDAPAIALLASHGIHNVVVNRRLRVALFSTGDELIETGASCAPGQVYDSNRAMLNVLLRQANCEVVDLGVVPDSPRLLHQAFDHAQANTDMVICTGGVSVGEEDHVRSVIEQRGDLHFHGVAIKPGKPFAFGSLSSDLSSSTPLMALPGNPVASLVGWQLLGRPFVHAMQNRRVEALEHYPVTAGFTRRGPRGRCELLRVVLEWQGGMHIAKLAGGQGSHMLSGASQASGYLMVHAETDILEGTAYPYYPVNQFIS